MMIELMESVTLLLFAGVSWLCGYRIGRMNRDPVVYRDGTKWCCMTGPDLQLGVAGFGDTKQEAIDSYWENVRS